MPRKQEYGTTDTSALLYYATFDSNLLSTELQQDLREIKAAGFGGLVLRDLPADTDGSDTGAMAAHAVQFAKSVKENGMLARLDLAYLAGTGADRADTLTAFLRSCAAGAGAVSGIDVPWPAEPPFSASVPDPKAVIPARCETVEKDYDSRRAAAERILREKTILENTGRELFGNGFDVRYYGSRSPISPVVAEFTPKTASAELREIGHAERIERRPAAPMTQFKAAASYGQAAGIAYPPVIIWGEDYGTVRASHSADIVSYWADLAATFNLAWQGWMYVRENSHFYRLIKKGVSHPYHPTWKRFGALLQKTALMRNVLGTAKTAGTLALVYPAATICAYEGDARDALDKTFSALAYRLLRSGYQFDIIPDDLLTRAAIEDTSIKMGGKSYTELIYPFPGTVPHNSWKNLLKFAASGAPCLFIGMPPEHTTTGKEILPEFEEALQGSVSRELHNGVRMTVGKRPAEPIPETEGGWRKPVWHCTGAPFPVATDRSQAAFRNGNAVYIGIMPVALKTESLIEVLSEIGITNTISAPETALINLLQEGDDAVFALCPAECGMVISGRVTWNDITFEVTDCREAFAVRINTKNGEVVSHAVCGDAEIKVELDID